jgi:hypothetical protein
MRVSEGSWHHGPASTMIARLNGGGEVRCHNGAVEKQRRTYSDRMVTEADTICRPS